MANVEESCSTISISTTVGLKNVFVITTDCPGCPINGVAFGLFVGAVDGDNKPNKIRINSPRIEFGIPTQTKKLEPVVKGDQLETILNEILDLLNSIVGTPGAYVPQGQVILKTLTQAKTELIKKKLKRFKSNKTYTV